MLLLTVAQYSITAHAVADSTRDHRDGHDYVTRSPRGADSTGGTLRATRVMGMAIAMQVTASQHVLETIWRY